MAEQVPTEDASKETKVCSQPLVSYLKCLIEDIESKLQSVSEYVDAKKQLREKCCTLLQSSQASDINTATLTDLIRNTAFMVLDYTYIDENILVDSQFPSDIADHKLPSIQEQLSGICDLAKKCLPDQTELTTLGEDIVECVHWRKGALYYMYCHTLNSHAPPNHPPCYRQCLEDGVKELGTMLRVRQPVSVPDEISADDTLQLFKHGAFSDTHLLAMMYAAELCYWYQQGKGQGHWTSSSEEESAPLCSSQQGLSLLRSFLAAVRGPLKDQGWTTTRAEELEQFFCDHP